jgi:hypothetical protein
MQQGIRFEDGDAYDRGMSPWSRLAGQTFLDWLSPRPAMARRRMRNRRIHRAYHRAMRVGRGAGRRSERGTTRDNRTDVCYAIPFGNP